MTLLVLGLGLPVCTDFDRKWKSLERKIANSASATGKSKSTKYCWTLLASVGYLRLIGKHGVMRIRRNVLLACAESHLRIMTGID